MPRWSVLFLGLELVMIFLLESPRGIQADHQCVQFTDPSTGLATAVVDGRYQSLTGTSTGARVRIGYVGNVLVPICNPVSLGSPVSTSGSWAMMADVGCLGWFQVGYIRGNWKTDQNEALDPQEEYYFQQYRNCGAPNHVTRVLTASPGIWSTSHCYTVTFSGLQQRWSAQVQHPPCGSGTGIIQWSWPADYINITADSVQYYGEVFDYRRNSPNGHNSDNMCGFSYNKCTWQKTQKRNLAGVWQDASTTECIGWKNFCGAPWGYCQHENNPTSFAIWTDCTGSGCP